MTTRCAILTQISEAAGNLHRRERYNEATVHRSWGILPLRSRNRSASENVIRVRVTTADRCVYTVVPRASAENWTLFATSLRHVTFTSLSTVRRLEGVAFFRMPRATVSENCGQSWTNPMTADYRSYVRRLFDVHS